MHLKIAGRRLCARMQSGYMPTVMRQGRWRIFFYSNEGAEPPHVHIESGGATAKFWLTPVALVRSEGISNRELRDLLRFLVRQRIRLLEAWNEYFRR
jgi:hypothetical protein